jgi:nitrogen fixation protein NifZ
LKEAAMMDLREPKFQWGQSVVALDDLYNDGSLPEVSEDLLLVAAGGPGEIVQVGHHSEANVPIYMVDFGVVVLGCLEEEIAPMPEQAPQALAAAATLKAMS